MKKGKLYPFYDTKVQAVLFHDGKYGTDWSCICKEVKGFGAKYASTSDDLHHIQFSFLCAIAGNHSGFNQVEYDFFAPNKYAVTKVENEVVELIYGAVGPTMKFICQEQQFANPIAAKFFDFGFGLLVRSLILETIAAVLFSQSLFLFLCTACLWQQKEHTQHDILMSMGDQVFPWGQKGSQLLIGHRKQSSSKFPYESYSYILLTRKFDQDRQEYTTVMEAGIPEPKNCRVTLKAVVEQERLGASRLKLTVCDTTSTTNKICATAQVAFHSLLETQICEALGILNINVEPATSLTAPPGSHATDLATSGTAGLSASVTLTSDCTPYQLPSPIDTMAGNQLPPPTAPSPKVNNTLFKQVVNSDMILLQFLFDPNDGQDARLMGKYADEWDAGRVVAEGGLTQTRLVHTPENWCWLYFYCGNNDRWAIRSFPFLFTSLIVTVNLEEEGINDSINLKNDDGELIVISFTEQDEAASFAAEILELGFGLNVYNQCSYSEPNAVLQRESEKWLGHQLLIHKKKSSNNSKAPYTFIFRTLMQQADGQIEDAHQQLVDRRLVGGCENHHVHVQKSFGFSKRDVAVGVQEGCLQLTLDDYTVEVDLAKKALTLDDYTVEVDLAEKAQILAALKVAGISFTLNTGGTLMSTPMQTAGHQRLAALPQSTAPTSMNSTSTAAALTSSCTKDTVGPAISSSSQPLSLMAATASSGPTTLSAVPSTTVPRLLTGGTISSAASPDSARNVYKTGDLQVLVSDDGDDEDEDRKPLASSHPATIETAPEVNFTENAESSTMPKTEDPDPIDAVVEIVALLFKQLRGILADKKSATHKKHYSHKTIKDQICNPRNRSAAYEVKPSASAPFGLQKNPVDGGSILPAVPTDTHEGAIYYTVGLCEAFRQREFSSKCRPEHYKNLCKTVNELIYTCKCDATVLNFIITVMNKEDEEDGKAKAHWTDIGGHLKWEVDKPDSPLRALLEKKPWTDIAKEAVSRRNGPPNTTNTDESPSTFSVESESSADLTPRQMKSAKKVVKSLSQMLLPIIQVKAPAVKTF